MNGETVMTLKSLVPRTDVSCDSRLYYCPQPGLSQHVVTHWVLKKDRLRHVIFARSAFYRNVGFPTRRILEVRCLTHVILHRGHVRDPMMGQ